VRLAFDAERRVLLATTLKDVGGHVDPYVLRHTLMNPYLVDHENGISYIDAYFAFLARHARQGAGLDLAA
jgi:hypothetical protein